MIPVWARPLPTGATVTAELAHASPRVAASEVAPRPCRAARVRELGKRRVLWGTGVVPSVGARLDGGCPCARGAG
eukprot:5099695-Prymnesium_polylepis.2